MTLNLVLIGQYFDLIKKGVKTMEFREITSYYVNRLMAGGSFQDQKDVEAFTEELKDKSRREEAMKKRGVYFRYGNGLASDYDKIKFFRGHTGVTMVVELKGIGFSALDNDYFVLTLGKILEKDGLRQDMR